ncbi:MAG: TrkH family potassium uptake protein [Candidatus Omnitrophica bacterium]|nr:TrkH family potassium uptake protein [Candidatus Omnitrophota bacterium]
MILRPQVLDLRIISHFLGKVVLGFGIMMAVPIAAAILFGETVPIIDFAISLFLSLSVGYLLVLCARLPKATQMSWMHGMVVVSLAWVVCMFLGAIPLLLSGHWQSYLDACFETMSGLATTGLVLVQDLDHLSHAANLWRHLIMFLGGQGIIVVALSFLVKGGPGAFRLYVGEAREEKILPNVVETAKFIWFVSFVYLVLGTLALAACGVWACGMPVREAIFHGACNFMAAFDTGGFTPQSQNIIYYQSIFYELATIVIMIWGSINFNLHYAVWTGRRKELLRDIEIRTFLVTLAIVTVLTLVGLGKGHVYLGPVNLIRRGFYQVVSGHTGTGFQTIYAQQFTGEWGSLAMIGVIMAMAFGVSACSTTGGIKMLRVGLIAKAFKEDVKRFLTSESAVVTTKFRHLRDLFLDDKLVRSAALITIAYILLYLGGAVVGCFFGYPFLQSLFESTSAAGNVGLSCGITQVSMPVLLKITYIIQMWAGRLEFISVFVLGAFMISFFRGK